MSALIVILGLAAGLKLYNDRQEALANADLGAAFKTYRDLANHPTLTVPKAAALLALADADRAADPAQSRKIYQDLEKEFSSDAALLADIKEQMSGLPK